MKHKLSNKQRRELLWGRKMIPILWQTVQEYDHYLIVKHRVTGSFRHLKK